MAGAHDTRSKKIRRRLVTIPRTFLTTLIVTVTLPLLLVVAVIVDGFRWATRRTPWVATRLLLLLLAYLWLGTLGLIGFGITWISALFGTRKRALVSSAYAIQRWWATSLLHVGMFLFALRLEVAGDEATSPGPIIMLMNHASLFDVVLPITAVAGPHKMNLRYIIKRELIADPALDVGGLRLPNYFVDRSGRTSDEARPIRELATGMSDRDGVLIYPEGTRFTEAARSRAISRLENADPATAEAAKRLRHVLPPRPAGTLAALEGAPDADVVIAAHVGLGGFARVANIWNGSIIGANVRMAVWRVPRKSIPDDRAGRVAWLVSEWQRVDDWIEGAS